MSSLVAVDVDARSAGAWDDLADRVGAPPFLRPGWFDAWRRAFGSGELQVIATSRGGEAAAVLPLLARRGRLRSPTNWHSPWYGVVAESSDAAAGVAADLAACPAHQVDLGHLLGDDSGTGLVADAFAAAGRRTIRRVPEQSPFVDTRGTWDDYVASRRGKFVRQLLRRRDRLAKLGEVRFETSDGTLDLDRTLRDGFALEASGWKGERRTAIASRAATAAFYADVARFAAERGWLRLAFLRLDSRPIAFALVLDDGGAHYALKTAYDQAHATYAAGNQLHWDLLHAAFGSSARRFELLGRRDRWKTEWSDAAHDMVRLQAFRPTAPGVAAWAAWTYGRPAAKWMLAALRPAGRR